jgi:hypothetical protein
MKIYAGERHMFRGSRSKDILEDAKRRTITFFKKYLKDAAAAKGSNQLRE